MFELLCVIIGIVILITYGPVWLGIVFLALGGIWYLGDGDFDWF